jgi:ATP-dependent DNA helicase RecG
MGVDCALLTGDTSAAEQRRARVGLRTGRIKAVVGTHALLYDKVDFDHLALVVIDEQHKFGVEQRARLLAKGAHPDVLVMSATPIPRTLAMTVFGDLDVSTIDELPANRQQIVTRVIQSEKLDEAYAFTRSQIEKGRQAFIIYPLVDESETLELKAAKTMFEHLTNDVFSGLELGLLHGKLGAQEKARVMSAFREGRSQVLVATTVVEVGVDVPNATVMIVENAERFGLAQLHQLRGRIGRGAHKSFCILQGDPKSADAWRRLKIMEETRDGFRIAEEDLKIRGMGNLLGTEQSGFPELKVGDPVRDADMLMVARREAMEQCARDPDGLDPEWALLRKQAARFFAERGQLTQAG